MSRSYLNALGAIALLTWWQFAWYGANGERRISPHYSTEKECNSALKASEAALSKRFPDRYPLVGSCEAYR